MTVECGSAGSLHRDADIQRLLDESDIRALLYRYCRGIDRRIMSLVRSAYHGDAYDDHGSFAGPIDGFIDHADDALGGFDRTMHFVGNMSIQIDGDAARCETYALTFHRLVATAGEPEVDLTCALRYVDQVERRDGEWRISHRVCVYDWIRRDEVQGGTAPAGFVRGERGMGDPVFGGVGSVW